MGIQTRPVLVGPVTYLSIGKVTGGNVNKFSLLENLVSVYQEILKKLEALGATDIQIDEPIAALDLTSEQTNALKSSFEALSSASSLNIHLATYFGDLRENKSTVFNLPVQSVHIDFTRGGETVADVLSSFPADKKLSLGLSQWS